MDGGAQAASPHIHKTVGPDFGTADVWHLSAGDPAAPKDRMGEYGAVTLYTPARVCAHPPL